MALDPIQVRKMVGHVVRHSTVPLDVRSGPQFREFEEICRLLESCNYNTSTLTPHFEEKKLAVEQYNHNLGSWQDVRTEDLPDYLDKLLLVFCGQLEEMPPLVSDTQPYIKGCALWRLENGR